MTKCWARWWLHLSRRRDGWAVSITLPKTCPEYAIFERLADTLGRTPVQLFGELTRGAVKRYMAGECG